MSQNSDVVIVDKVYLFRNKGGGGIKQTVNNFLPLERRACLRGLLDRGFMVLCGSKNYPYLPHGRDFFLDPPPPHLSGNSSQALYIYLNCWAFETPPPTPPGISNPFCGGRRMDIFWNYTTFKQWEKTRQMKNSLIECTYCFKSVSLAISMCLITTFWNMASSSASGLN